MPRQIPLAFATALDQLRQGRRLSYSDLARGLTVSVSQVSRWCRGETTPTVDAIAQIADYFGVDRETLERLAGYRANTASRTQDTINPEMAMRLDAEVQALKELLEGVPEPFWTVILAAMHEGTRLAADNVRAALKLALNQGTISTPPDDQLAPPQQDEPQHKQRGKSGRNDGLTAALLAPA